MLRSYLALVESFDAPTDWRWVETYAGIRIAEFEVSGNVYRVWISGVHALMVSFELVGRGQGITGTGSPMTVFATVLDVLRSFLLVNKPRSFAFEARKNQPSRVRLYQKMCAKLAPELTDYELEIDPDNEKDVYFQFTRKDVRS